MTTKTTTTAKRRQKRIGTIIQIGELRELGPVTGEFYDRLLAFIGAHPHSLLRLFEIGCVAAMAAFSGDDSALQFIRQDRQPARARARRKSRTPQAKAKKRP